MAAHVHTGQDTIYRLSRRSFPQIIRIRTVGARAVNKRREIMALSLVVYRIQIQIPHDPFCILCISQRNITFPKMYESLTGVVFFWYFHRFYPSFLTNARKILKMWKYQSTKLRKLIRNSYRWTRFWFPRTIESEQPVLDGYACNPTVSTPLESSISPLNRVRRLVSVRFNPRRYGKHTNAIVRARIFFSADFEFPRIWYRDLVVGIRRQSLGGGRKFICASFAFISPCVGGKVSSTAIW